MFGDRAGTPVLGLPGNPVSAVVCSLLFARPALNALLGLDVPAHPLEPMALGAALPANDRRQDYLRATAAANGDGRRSAERRVGKEWVRTCRSRWSPDPLKKQKNTTI